MSTINLPGLSTGIDTGQIIQQLMAVQGRRKANYQVQQSEMEEKVSAYSNLRNAIQSVNGAVDRVSSSENLTSFNTRVSNDDVLAISTSSSASEGTHNVQVKQRAASETWINDGSDFRYKSDYVGQGRFIYSYNGYERVISTVEDETTLEDLVNLINNDENNPGVSASLLNQGGSYHLMLSGRQTGTDYNISINQSNTELWTTTSELTTTQGRRAELSTRINRLEQFSGSLEGGESITISGTTNDGTAVSHDIEIHENTTVEHLLDGINDAYDGTATAVLDRGRIRLLDSTSGESLMTFELEYNPGSGESSFDIPSTTQSTVGGSVNADLDSFEPESFLKTQSAQDSLIKVNGYPPGEDNWIANSTNTITDVIGGVTLDLKSASEYNESTGTYQPVDIAINKNTSAVKDRLEGMVSAYNEAIKLILEKTEYDLEKEEAGILSGESSVSFMRTNMRAPFGRIATGFIETLDSFVQARDIGLTVDGRGMLELDTDQLEQAINEDYEGVVDLLAGSGIGTSSNSSVQFYNASDRTEPGTYNVRVECDDAGNVTGAWIKTSSQSEWREMNVQGDVMQGPLNLSSDDPERGLQLMFHWDGQEHTSENPIEATIRVKEGIATSLDRTLDEFLESDGRIAISQDNLNRRIDNLQDRIDREQRRLETEENRLVMRYARLERTLTEMQQQMEAAGLMGGA